MPENSRLGYQMVPRHIRFICTIEPALGFKWKDTQDLKRIYFTKSYSKLIRVVWEPLLKVTVISLLLFISAQLRTASDSTFWCDEPQKLRCIKKKKYTLKSHATVLLFLHCVIFLVYFKGTWEVQNFLYLKRGGLGTSQLPIAARV